MNRIVQGDNLPVLQGMETGSVALIYVDPPFNTGAAADAIADAVGAGRGWGPGRVWRKAIPDERIGEGEAGAGGGGYADDYDDFIGFLRPRMMEAWRVLSPTGSLFLHLDYREVHYAKVMLDEVFGRSAFRTRLSGRMTMGRVADGDGRPSTTTYFGTRGIRSGTRSTWRRVTESRTWLRSWWCRRRRRWERRRRMCGGTRS